MLTLFYSPGACSLAAHVCLEEIGEPFEPVRISLADGEQRGEAFLRVNPKGRVPALSDEGWVLTENPAILRFLADRFPQAGLWPSEPRDSARASEWVGWLASTLHVAYAHNRRPERYAGSEAGMADVRERASESCRALWEDVEARLGDGWAVGERFSVVDAYLLVFWCWGRGPALAFDMAALFPRWNAHARRTGERVAVRRVFEREKLVLPS